LLHSDIINHITLPSADFNCFISEKSPQIIEMERSLLSKDHLYFLYTEYLQKSAYPLILFI